MFEFKVTSINDGKSVTAPEQLFSELFGQIKWEEIKRGEYLPWIEVEKQIPTIATKYFNQGPRLSTQNENSLHSLPWSTEEPRLREGMC